MKLSTLTFYIILINEQKMFYVICFIYNQLFQSFKISSNWSVIPLFWHTACTRIKSLTSITKCYYIGAIQNSLRKVWIYLEKITLKKNSIFMGILKWLLKFLGTPRPGPNGKSSHVNIFIYCTQLRTLCTSVIFGCNLRFQKV